MPTNPLSLSACPWLGMAPDQGTHYGYASSGNECYSPAGAGKLTASRQEQYCLTAQHPHCPRFASIPPDGSAVENAPAITVVRMKTRISFRSKRGIAAVAILGIAGLALAWILLSPRVMPAPVGETQETPRPTVMIPVANPAFLPTEPKLPTTVPQATARVVLPNPTAAAPLAVTAIATMTPLATATTTRRAAPQATATAAPSSSPYPAPRLVGPPNGSTIAHMAVDFRWEPSGNLRADEWYDVQVWSKDTQPHGVAWVKEPHWTMPANYASGNYQWRVIVIRTKDGERQADASLPSEIWSVARK